MDAMGRDRRVEWSLRAGLAVLAAVLIVPPLWWLGVIFPREGHGDRVSPAGAPVSCAHAGAVCVRTLPAPFAPAGPADGRQDAPIPRQALPAGPPTAPPSPAPLASGRPAPRPARDEIEASVTIAYDTIDFRSGYLAHVTVHNTGARPIMGWTVRMRLRTGRLTGWKGASISIAPNGWLTAMSRGGTAMIAPGGSASFTFTNAGAPDWSPSGCTVNGRACAGRRVAVPT